MEQSAFEKFAIVVAVSFGFATATWAIFVWLQQLTSPSQRASFARWIETTDPKRRASSWAEQCSLLLDRVFGPEHLSARCFLRSCLVSYLSVFALLTLGLVFVPGFFFGSKPGEPPGALEKGVAVGILFLSASVFNVLADYLSLVESRYVLRRMARARSIVAIAGFLTLDLLASGLIISIAMMVPVSALMAATGQLTAVQVLASGLGVVVESLLLTGSVGAIFFYSTFSTSIWIWLYAISAGVVRVAATGSAGMSAMRTLDYTEQPYRLIGGIAAAVVFLLFFTLGLVVEF